MLRFSQDPTFMRHTQAAPTFQAGEHDARELQVVMYTAIVLLRYGDNKAGVGARGWSRFNGQELAPARQSPGHLAAGLSHDAADAVGCSSKAAHIIAARKVKV